MDDSISVVSRLTASTAISSLSVGNSTIQTQTTNGSTTVPTDTSHRAIHRIRVSALTHNYNCVESAANRQRCSVIVVVKADGYGHGAINTALRLADSCGAEAFAVATLGEAIALRRAFETTPPFAYRRKPAANKPIPTSSQSSDVSTLFAPPDVITTDKMTEDAVQPSATAPQRSQRPAFIRILVLGPPVGFPRCFDDYYHHSIEVMVSGPEVAAALMEWVHNAEERKRTQVERAANAAKAQALAGPEPMDVDEEENNPKVLKKAETDPDTPLKPTATPAYTLTSVSGHELATEMRAILMNQEAAKKKGGTSKPTSTTTSAAASTTSSGKTSPVSVPTNNGGKLAQAAPATTEVRATAGKGELFGGIEAAAMTSRSREQAAARVAAVAAGEEASIGDSTSESIVMAPKAPVRRRLRWHALVDSGMGRLGFKTDPLPGEDKEEKLQQRDTVSILKELTHAELEGAPIEFYGMCTHMAEANSTSSYTNSQMSRFQNLLDRVRDAKIFVPTLSTDNSSALLTTTLNHFNPDVILKQQDADTRGWVRTGGAIYGQRADFTQLHAVSTLMASVRHVAVLKQGDSAGYDRAYVAENGDVRIATLTIGFADGYPRELGKGVGRVSIRGSTFPIAGNVCMDMIMVDLGPATDIDGVGAQVAVGDTAVLWGPESEEDTEGLVRLKDLAAALNTTQSALTCGLDKIRVEREYV